MVGCLRSATPDEERAAQRQARELLALGDRFAWRTRLPLVLAVAGTAATGNVHAMAALGWYYGNGNGVAQDYSKAVKWYRRAAEGGNALAMTALGSYYAQAKVLPRPANPAPSSGMTPAQAHDKLRFLRAGQSAKPIKNPPAGSRFNSSS